MGNAVVEEVEGELSSHWQGQKFEFIRISVGFRYRSILIAFGLKLVYQVFGLKLGKSSEMIIFGPSFEVKKIVSGGLRHERN